MSAYFATGAFRDKKSWHGLELDLDHAGGIFTGKVDIWEIMQSASMDYEIFKQPIGVYLPDGTLLQDKGRWALMRPPVAWEDEWQRLRVVGNRYVPLQHQRLAEILEPLQNHWELEGVMVLKNGKISVVELKLDPFDVAGHEKETTETYLLVADDKTENSTFWGLTTVRVVCSNTYAMAQSQKTLTKIPHGKSNDQELKFRSQIAQLMIEQRQQTQQVLDELFKTKVNKDQVTEFMDDVIELPNKPRYVRLAEEVPATISLDGEQFTDFNKELSKDEKVYFTKVQRAEKMRKELRDAFGRFNDEYPYAGDTAYGLFQATTDFTNHSPMFTGSAEKGLVSLLFGQKRDINVRAWNKAVEYAEIEL